MPVRREPARQRTCVGCGAREALDAPDLVRLVLGPGGAVAVDAGGGSFGRGAHVHARPDCIDKAERGLARSFKQRVCIDPAELARMITDAMDRRVRGLLASAARSGAMARGADAVTQACKRGETALVVVAKDAAAAAGLDEVRRAASRGLAVAWGTKRAIADSCPGGSTRSDGVAVVAITSQRIAEALRAAAQAADSVSAARQPAGGRHDDEHTASEEKRSARLERGE